MKTVRDLIAELRHLPQDSVVVLASDAEGNYYHELDVAAEGYYSIETEDGEIDIIFHETDLEEDEEVGPPMIPTVVIWPY